MLYAGCVNFDWLRRTFSLQERCAPICELVRLNDGQDVLTRSDTRVWSGAWPPIALKFKVCSKFERFGKMTSINGAD